MLSSCKEKASIFPDMVHLELNFCHCMLKFILCPDFVLQKRPPDNAFYVKTCSKNPKKTRWWYHGEFVRLFCLFNIPEVLSPLISLHCILFQMTKYDRIICMLWQCTNRDIASVIGICILSYLLHDELSGLEIRTDFQSIITKPPETYCSEIRVHHIEFPFLNLLHGYHV